MCKTSSYRINSEALPFKNKESKEHSQLHIEIKHLKNK